jgi:hypothetical protein
MDRRSIEVCGLLPQFSGNSNRIKLDRFPPCRFAVPAMEHTMVSVLQGEPRTRHPAAERARLGKSQTVRVGRPASAQEAGFRGHEFRVGAIAIAARFAVCQDAFIDMPSHGVVHRFVSAGRGRRKKKHTDGGGFGGRGRIEVGGICSSLCRDRFLRAKACQLTKQLVPRCC